MNAQGHSPIRRLRRSRGVGIVTAIFLLVVLAGLGVAIMTVSTSQQTSAALDELGARAYQAARAGAEFGLYQGLRLNSCAAETALSLPAGTSLSVFAVTVQCSETVDATTGVIRRSVRSTACNQPNGASCLTALRTSPDYVQRVVEVNFSVEP